MATSRTKAPKATDTKRITDLLGWCRANGFSVGAISVGDVHLAVTDLRVGAAEAASAPRNELAADAKPGEREVDTLYDEYGRNDPGYERFRAERDASDAGNVTIEKD